MILIESILTENPCYKAGKKIAPQGLMLEGVRCPQPSAKVFIHNWNREGCDTKCVHAFIDGNTGTVYQTLPWNHRALHCGKHPRTKMTANDTHIGIKMCEPPQIKYKNKFEIEVVGDRAKAVECVNRTYNAAVELFARLCKDFKLDPKTAIISQKEGYDLGIAAMHNDPTILWKTLGLPYTMDSFRSDVAHVLAKMPDVTVTHNAKTPLVVKAPDSVVNPMINETEEMTNQMIRITVPNLRIRSTPCAGDNFTGKYTGVGVFAITEIQNGTGSKKGWGKLRDKSGWVSLDYVEML